MTIFILLLYLVAIFFYKSCVDILKYRAVVVIVSVRQRSKGRIFVASTIYIWRLQNSVFNLPQNFISQNHRTNIAYSDEYSLEWLGHVPDGIFAGEVGHIFA